MNITKNYLNYSARCRKCGFTTIVKYSLEDERKLDDLCASCFLNALIDYNYEVEKSINGVLASAKAILKTFS